MRFSLSHMRHNLLILLTKLPSAYLRAYTIPNYYIRYTFPLIQQRESLMNQSLHGDGIRSRPAIAGAVYLGEVITTQWPHIWLHGDLTLEILMLAFKSNKNTLFPECSKHLVGHPDTGSGYQIPVEPRIKWEIEHKCLEQCPLTL